MGDNAVVIGASAVGSITSRELARRGIDVDLLEEDSKVGKFGKCGGIFSKHGMDYTGVNYRDLILNEIRGARIIVGSEQLRVRRSEVQAVVLSRQSFDERAADEAVSEGVNLHLNTRIGDFKTNGKISAISTDGALFSTKVLVGCDGNSSITARKLGFPSIKLSDCVIAYQAEFTKADVPEKDVVDLILDNKKYRNFFAWTIPLSEEKIRIGVATSDIQGIEAARKAAFLDANLAPILEHGQKTFEFYHMIPLKARNVTQKRFGDSYAFLAGDAAGQVKATSGGGVNFGAKCAKVAAREAANFLLKGTLPDYETAWRSQHGETLKLHYLLHRLYRLMPNWLSEIGLGTGRRIGLEKLLEKYGDMDYVFKL